MRNACNLGVWEILKNSNTSQRCCRTYFHKSRRKPPHEVLKIERTASKKKIKSAFLELSKQYHPDKNRDDPNAHQKFVELNNAYQEMMMNFDTNHSNPSRSRRGGYSSHQHTYSSYYDYERHRQWNERMWREHEKRQWRQMHENYANSGQGSNLFNMFALMYLSVMFPVWIYHAVKSQINYREKRKAKREEEERMKQAQKMDLSEK